MLYGLGLILLVIGVFLKIFPPKKMNYFYGNRSSIALKNQDAWDEAQRFSAFTKIISGLSMFVSGLVVYQVFNITDKSNRFLIIIIVAICAIGMVVADESHLTKIFNRDGSRKKK
jgi:uncharacterized membrane protein